MVTNMKKNKDRQEDRQEDKQEDKVDFPILDKVAQAKEARKKAYDASKAVSNEKINNRDEFRKFFIKIKGKLGLSADMEEVIWLHFKSYSFIMKEKFEDGIRHFGYKI